MQLKSEGIELLRADSIADVEHAIHFITTIDPDLYAKLCYQYIELGDDDHYQ